MLNLPEFRELGNAPRGGLDDVCPGLAFLVPDSFERQLALTVVTLQEDRILVSGAQRMPILEVDRPEYRERKAQ
ncbi:hypothetical protein V7I75_31000 [Pseudomonas aeruginosa]|uniref:Uncharacterized protein n=1 Tax=Pseudomonas aeruginosa TaxID=287 RepID=A0AAQ3LIC1_PSEAI|nr:hypothetical protein [Pseudomonas aeruginosa]EIU1491866.1 hypothetical protein [Pseudomonas aeruginosa]EIU2571796.1 hypothetical protein [Pseudomonas aeruginosa]EIU2725785.1 hypothetical protein [Pseudomonas aeruginosa]EIU2788311.1 hypothetical protein [Pseudomonas aeruginosa]EIU3316664.1 hypothetical protein [Pseudomonas aeruginosa]